MPAGDCARLLLLRLARTVLLPRLIGPVLAGLAVWPDLAGRAGLPGLADWSVRIDEVRIGLAEGAPLLEHAAADRLRGMHLADKTLAGTFTANLETLPGARPDPATLDWWRGHPEAYQATRIGLEKPELLLETMPEELDITFDSSREAAAVVIESIDLPEITIPIVLDERITQ